MLAYRTSPLTSTVNKNPRKTGPPARTKLDIPEEYQHPAFCNGVECPKYRLVKKYPGFEHREYDATKWVSTPVTLDDEGTEAAYINLFKYINGSNSEGMHLSITSPVVVSFKLGYREPKTGTMSIFLSANLKNPPAPLNSNTFLQSYPKASLYVK
ncbi:hypothetical protein GDO81_029494 [Engystomops pustulosus]|uniref:Heme-binding protein 2 n=1 Tax=Engystomops pustulosus TaxID=76066 RepID=A0AAV6ZRT4_ENGPU|nr:hypothetical protein GDO81_029494 [Engystomops pustulosus]